MTKYYCPPCDRYVTGKKIFHSVSFVLLCLFIWIPGVFLFSLAITGSIMVTAYGDPTASVVIWVGWMLLPVLYVFYHVLIKTPRCPICNSKLRRGEEPIRRRDEYHHGSELQGKLDSPEIEKSIYKNDLMIHQTEKEQLEQVIEDIKRRHGSEIAEKDAAIRELKAAIRTKRRTEDVTHAEYTQEYFPKFVIGVLNLLDPKKKLSFWYIKMMSLLNYMFVCGIGLFINMYVLYAFVGFLPLWLANLFAILTAFTWNWTLTVGPLGYFMGLSPMKKEVKQT